MPDLFYDFTHYLAERLLRYRNYPFLRATMAACALVDAADGNVTILEWVRVDQVMETIVNIYHEWLIPILMVEQNVTKSLEIAQRIYVFVRGRNGLEANAEDVTSEKLRQLFLEGTSEVQ